MGKFQVLTDSTSDVEKELRESVGLDYINMVFTLEGIEYQADLDWGKIKPQVYYDKMSNGNRSITGLAPFGNIESKFRNYLEKGRDILFIACSSKLSGTFNNAKIVADELLQEYPDRKIICFDSLRSNYAEGLMALDAARMAMEGKEIEEVVKYLEENCLNYQVYATAENLNYLKLAGRVKATTAFFGNLFGVKPIIVSDAKGNNYAFKKVKGRKNSLMELAQIVKDRVINPETATVFIEHADALEEAMFIASLIEGYVKNIHISYIGPIIGATIGPKSITICFYGKKVEIASEE